MGYLSPNKAGPLLAVDMNINGFHTDETPLIDTLDLIVKDRKVVRTRGNCREHLLRTNFSALILLGWQANRKGIELLSDARRAAPDMPILVIGSPGRPQDEVAAYEWGADNFFEFSCVENAIVARLKRLIKMRPASNQAISVHDLQIWADSGVAFRSGKPIKLSSKEKELLLYLVANRSRPVSRQEILKNVFGLSFEPGTNVVEVHIHRLRRKIDGGHRRSLLNTIRGSGYVLGDQPSELAYT